jgi:hypothetical protein
MTCCRIRARYIVRWACEVCGASGQVDLWEGDSRTLHRCWKTFPLWPWTMEAAGMRRR